MLLHVLLIRHVIACIFLQTCYCLYGCPYMLSCVLLTRQFVCTIAYLSKVKIFKLCLKFCIYFLVVAHYSCPFTLFSVYDMLGNYCSYAPFTFFMCGNKKYVFSICIILCMYPIEKLFPHCFFGHIINSRVVLLLWVSYWIASFSPTLCNCICIYSITNLSYCCS